MDDTIADDDSIIVEYERASKGDAWIAVSARGGRKVGTAPTLSVGKGRAPFKDLAV